MKRGNQRRVNLSLPPYLGEAAGLPGVQAQLRKVLVKSYRAWGTPEDLGEVTVVPSKLSRLTDLYSGGGGGGELGVVWRSVGKPKEGGNREGFT